MSHAVKVLQGTLRRLVTIQAALALAAAAGYLVINGALDAVSALFGGGIALLNSLISARHLARAARHQEPRGQLAELYVGAVVRFVATPALVAVGILALGLDAVAIIVGFAVTQIAYFIGGERVGPANSN